MAASCQLLVHQEDFTQVQLLQIEGFSLKIWLMTGSCRDSSPLSQAVTGPSRFIIFMIFNFFFLQKRRKWDNFWYLLPSEKLDSGSVSFLVFLQGWVWCKLVKTHHCPFLFQGVELIKDSIRVILISRERKGHTVPDEEEHFPFSFKERGGRPNGSSTWTESLTWPDLTQGGPKIIAYLSKQKTNTYLQGHFVFFYRRLPANSMN